MKLMQVTRVKGHCPKYSGNMHNEFTLAVR